MPMAVSASWSTMAELVPSTVSKPVAGAVGDAVGYDEGHVRARNEHQDRRRQDEGEVKLGMDHRHLRRRRPVEPRRPSESRRTAIP